MEEKIIKDYPNYKITTEGKIYSRYKPKAKKDGKGIVWDKWTEIKHVYDKSCGYMLVTLTNGNGQRQNKRVHRLLMEAFVPNPHNYPHINHIDGNKLNNSLSNLEWCSVKHNTQEAIRLGLMKPYDSPLNRAIVQMTNDFEFIAEYKSLHEATRATGIAWQNIWKVCDGRRPRAGGYRWKYKESVTTIPEGSTSK